MSVTYEPGTFGDHYVRDSYGCQIFHTDGCDHCGVTVRMGQPMYVGPQWNVEPLERHHGTMPQMAQITTDGRCLCEDCYDAFGEEDPDDCEFVLHAGRFREIAKDARRRLGSLSVDLDEALESQPIDSPERTDRELDMVRMVAEDVNGAIAWLVQAEKRLSRYEEDQS